MVNGYAINHLGSLKNKSHAKAAQVDINQMVLISYSLESIANTNNWCENSVLLDKTKSYLTGLNPVRRDSCLLERKMAMQI